MVVEAKHFYNNPSVTVPDVVSQVHLYAEDAALSDEYKISKAWLIMFSEEYMSQKRVISEYKSKAMEEILDLLRQNARLTADDIAAMTKKSVDEVKAIIKKLEDDGVILGYAAIVNPEKDAAERDKVLAEIQIQVQPQREHGFDAIADRIYRFPQVRSLYLMSGGYDLKVVIEGDNLRDVAMFVSEKLSTLDGVRSTKTSFILKKYKENDIVYVVDENDSREMHA